MKSRFCVIKVGRSVSYSCLVLLLTISICLSTLIQPSIATNVKWTGNTDPNAPEAAKVPRSQKYWDENNIERPDYAKTDAEILQEKLVKLNSETDKKTVVLMIVAFLLLWGFIVFKYVLGGKLGGQKLGSSGASSGIGTQMSLEEKARQARLARFEAMKIDKED